MWNKPTRAIATVLLVVIGVILNYSLCDSPKSGGDGFMRPAQGIGYTAALVFGLILPVIMWGGAVWMLFQKDPPNKK